MTRTQHYKNRSAWRKTNMDIRFLLFGVIELILNEHGVFSFYSQLRSFASFPSRPSHDMNTSRFKLAAGTTQTGLCIWTVRCLEHFVRLISVSFSICRFACSFLKPQLKYLGLTLSISCSGDQDCLRITSVWASCWLHVCRTTDHIRCPELD